VYDIRSPKPRPTALAALFRALAKGNEITHPVTEVPGWWERPERLFPGLAQRSGRDPLRSKQAAIRPVLIFGADESLANQLQQECEARAIVARRTNLSSEDVSALEETIVRQRPWAIVDCGGPNPDRNSHSQLSPLARLTQICSPHSIRLLAFFTEAVFDGKKQRPYVESDAASPLTPRGRAQANAEALLLSSLPSALVIRTGPLFGADTGCLTLWLRDLAAGQRVEVPMDSRISPSYISDLAHCALDLLLDGACGIWHLANQGSATWFDMVTNAAGRLGIPQGFLDIAPQRRGEKQSFRNLVLSSERAWIMPPLESALDRYCRQLESSFLLREAA
jgi:dTDP-4-dehydrorhamnose reductase